MSSNSWLGSLMRLSLLAAPALASMHPMAISNRLGKQHGLKTFSLDSANLDLVGNSTFTQPVDHDDPSKGTYEQRYWWNAQYFKEGGPVFVMASGEFNAEDYVGYLQDTALPGFYAKEFGGAAVLVEHRYWGESLPNIDTFDAETLQGLNLPSAIKDLTNFAKNVDCEFCQGGTCNADQNPWVLIGGSYSAALAAWTSRLDPGVYAAYHASSGVVQSVWDFWQYYSPIAEALPEACREDVKRVIAHVDEVMLGEGAGNEDDVSALKKRFGLQALNDADFADVLADPMTWWQSDQDQVYAFCDYMAEHQSKQQSQSQSQPESREVDDDDGKKKKMMTMKIRGATDSRTSSTSSSSSSMYYPRNDNDTTTPPPKTEAALAAYAAYTRENSGCGSDGSSCDTYDDSIAWDQPHDLDSQRPWMWMLCNEPFGWWQVGQPYDDDDDDDDSSSSSSSAAAATTDPSTKILSSAMRPSHMSRRCALTFPETNGFNPGFVAGWTNEQLNAWTGGWSLDGDDDGGDKSYDKVVFVDGEFDPWRSAGVSSSYRPGGPLATVGKPYGAGKGGNTAAFVVKDGVHCPELFIDENDADTWPVIQGSVEKMREWLGEWKSERGN